MKTFKVAVEWTMTKTLNIEAEDLDDAIEQAEDMDVPTDGEYLDESFCANHDLSEELNAEDEDSDDEDTEKDQE